jgi:hypothetical protein
MQKRLAPEVKPDPIVARLGPSHGPPLLTLRRWGVLADPLADLRFRLRPYPAASLQARIEPPALVRTAADGGRRDVQH